MTSYHPISCPCGDVEGLIVLEDAGFAAVEQICVPQRRELREARRSRAASVWVLRGIHRGPPLVALPMSVKAGTLAAIVTDWLAATR